MMLACPSDPLYKYSSVCCDKHEVLLRVMVITRLVSFHRRKGSTGDEDDSRLPYRSISSFQSMDASESLPLTHCQSECRRLAVVSSIQSTPLLVKIVGNGFRFARVTIGSENWILCHEANSGKWADQYEWTEA